ncbi:hypothetical protein ACFWF3_28870 [Nocardia sp. NPDC060220]|uniref:LmrA/YxaF family transcription factor n=1 Tax=Nocardia sp. NPDC060220 TaxID=3347076 RepID=UPI003667D2FA
MAAEGVAPARAERLATMAIASVEGAVILCRVHRSTTALDEVVEELRVLLATAVGT